MEAATMVHFRREEPRSGERNSNDGHLQADKQTTITRAGQTEKRAAKLKKLLKKQRKSQKIARRLTRRIAAAQNAVISLQKRNSALIREKNRLENELIEEEKSHQVDAEQATGWQQKVNAKLSAAAENFEVLKRINDLLKAQEEAIHAELEEERNIRESEFRLGISESRRFEKEKADWEVQREGLVMKFEEEMKRSVVELLQGRKKASEFCENPQLEKTDSGTQYEETVTERFHLFRIQQTQEAVLGKKRSEELDSALKKEVQRLKYECARYKQKLTRLTAKIKRTDEEQAAQIDALEATNANLKNEVQDLSISVLRKTAEIESQSQLLLKTNHYVYLISQEILDLVRQLQMNIIINELLKAVFVLLSSGSLNAVQAFEFATSMIFGPRALGSLQIQVADGQGAVHLSNPAFSVPQRDQ